MATPQDVAARYGISLMGAHTNQLPGEQAAFLDRYLAAVHAAGGTQINVISGYRSPAYNQAVGGASNSNHTRGVAIDSSVYIPGKGWVMGGDLPTLTRFGLRSGDQAGFFHGQPDPEHVDAGYLAGAVGPPTVGGQPLTQPTLSRIPAAQPGQPDINPLVLALLAHRTPQVPFHPVAPVFPSVAAAAPTAAPVAAPAPALAFKAPELSFATPNAPSLLRPAAL